MSISAPRDDEFTLLELADRLLNKGVVLTGEATISVAGVDLIYLGLNVVLTAVENLKSGNPPAARDYAD
jgi:gas vesicle structural protein